MSRFLFLLGLGKDLKGTLETHGPRLLLHILFNGDVTLLHERFEDKKE